MEQYRDCHIASSLECLIGLHDYNISIFLICKKRIGVNAWKKSLENGFFFYVYSIGTVKSFDYFNKDSNNSEYRGWVP